MITPITPRRTRLLRTADLSTFQRAIFDLIATTADPWDARRTVVLVPTAAAAAVLRRSLEARLAPDSPYASTLGTAVALPHLLTRDGWYRQMHELRTDLPALLRPVERDARMLAAARLARRTAEPPFKLRPGLTSAIVTFYDQLKRHRRSIDAFERVLTDDLEPSVELDRGARRLLRQTEFLVGTFRRYESELEADGRLDEHRLRERLIGDESQPSLDRVVVTVMDHVNDAAGLWPADFDLLTRMPGLASIDIVASDRSLDSGFYERVIEALPGIDEARIEPVDAPPLVIATPPSSEDGYFVWRDREEELLAVIRRVKHRPAAGRVGVVYRRPLPYLYLARQLFERAGVPCHSFDALPLATDPHVAAVDLVCGFVLSRYDRRSTVALLRSPHFSFSVRAGALDPEAVEALDHALSRARHIGGRERLVTLAAEWAEVGDEDGAGSPEVAQALGVAIGLATELAPLETAGPIATQLDLLAAFLRRHAASSAPARDVVGQLLDELAQAHRHLPDEAQAFAETVAMVKRVVEGQTSTTAGPVDGLQLVDARAAVYGTFDELFVLGLVDGEWPEASERNVFYPSSLLTPLGWPRERDSLRAARAAFADLLALSRERVTVSTISLENDSVVTPSVLLEEVAELAGARMPTEIDDVDEDVCVTPDDALALSDVGPDDLDPSVAPWLAWREEPRAGERPGLVGPCAPERYSVSGLELYLECPFKYFARRVLRLDEEPLDESATTPRRLGQVLHAVFESFFSEWRDPRGSRNITIETMDLALARFREVADTELARLPASERAVIRSWLVGSAAAAGLAERLFALEVIRPGDVQERLTELRVDGEFLLAGERDPRPVRLRGVVDRVDLFSDGTFRVVDYKTNRPPERDRSLQLSLYARCLEDWLDHAGQRWRVTDASYAAFGDARVEVSLAGPALDEERSAGERRAVDVVERIERGEFPVRPHQLYRCNFCEYPTVCRKDYVGDE